MHPNTRNVTISTTGRHRRYRRREPGGSGQRRVCTRLGLTFSLLTAMAPSLAHAGVMSVDADYFAQQSIFKGGPSAGFDRSGTLGSGVGVRYRARADSGTVTADVNGRIDVVHDDVLDIGEQGRITLDYVGESSSVGARLGASASVSAFVDILPSPFPDISLDLIDEGFFTDPGRTFSGALDATQSDRDVDNAVGVGGINLFGLGSIGASANLDVAHTISLTLNDVRGRLRGVHRATGTTFLQDFTIATTAGLSLATQALDLAGMWDFDLLGIALGNSFRNDINLDVRPAIDYVIGSWPPPGSPLFSVGLIDETFALGFSTLDRLDAFSIEVRARVPAASTALLLLAALGALFVLRRRPA